MNRVYELCGITFAYDTEPVLSFDYLQVTGSEIVALVGPNGAGKSTLLNLLAFLASPDRGVIRYRGSRVTPDNSHQFRREIGYVQQKPYLFQTSVRRNIEMGLRLRGVERGKIFELTQKVIMQFGLQALTERNARDLSGGETQKVAIARAMVMNPNVLLLDEPFSHLDRHFRQDLEALLVKIKNEAAATIIFTTHDHLQAQMLSNQVVTMVDGHLLPISVTNLFRGKVEENKFNTGRISITLPDHIRHGTRLAVDSTNLVLSRAALHSSMRNNFKGKVIKISEENGQIHVVLQAEERFHAVVTQASIQALGIGVGDELWVSFKSTAVHLF